MPYEVRVKEEDPLPYEVWMINDEYEGEERLVAKTDEVEWADNILADKELGALEGSINGLDYALFALNNIKEYLSEYNAWLLRSEAVAAEMKIVVVLHRFDEYKKKRLE